MNNLINNFLYESDLNLDHMRKVLECKDLMGDNFIAFGIYKYPGMELINYNKYFEKIFRMYCLNKKENIEINLKKIVGEANNSRIVRKEFINLLNTKERQILNRIYINTKSGERKCFECVATPIIENNRIKYIIVSIVNNTKNIELEDENKLLKIKIKELEKKIDGYKNIIDQSFTKKSKYSYLIKNNELILFYYLFRRQKELEDILKNQEEFFSFIVHEFRTPLTIINSSIQLINNIYSSEVSNNVKKYINKMNISTLQQLRLVNNLLDISKASAGYLDMDYKNYDIVSVTKLITESVRSFALRKNVKLELICDFEEKIIAIDEEKYERILLNLLSNAIKFTPENKFVKILVDANEKFINICVQDEGCGISKDKLEIIFDRFIQLDNGLTRQSGGTGIGLCLVKLLIEAMEGKIEVISEIGKGSKFIISLPNKKIDGNNNNLNMELLNNRLIQTLNIEFSNIYFD